MNNFYRIELHDNILNEIQLYIIEGNSNNNGISNSYHSKIEKIFEDILEKEDLCLIENLDITKLIYEVVRNDAVYIPTSLFENTDVNRQIFIKNSGNFKLYTPSTSL